jgi:hypothetical protein
MVFGLFLFASCEKNEPELFQNEDSFIAFERSSGSLNEAVMVDGVPVEQEIEIRVMLVTLDNSPVNVTFEFNHEGIDNPAVEGEAFELLNTSKTLSFPNGMGYQSIRIRSIDDDIFTANRQVNIKLTGNDAGYGIGAESNFRLTVVDNEHPLNLVLGTYSASGTDAWGDAVSATIETRAVEGILDQVAFPLSHFAAGWGAPAAAMVFAEVDLDEMTFKIRVGQDYASFGYGPCKISGYDGATGDSMEDGEYIVALIDEDGNLDFQDYMGLLITEGGNAGLSFEIWSDDVVWTKVAKDMIDPASIGAPRNQRVLRSF